MNYILKKFTYNILKEYVLFQRPKKNLKYIYVHIYTYMYVLQMECECYKQLVCIYDENVKNNL